MVRRVLIRREGIGICCGGGGRAGKRRVAMQNAGGGGGRGMQYPADYETYIYI